MVNPARLLLRPKSSFLWEASILPVSYSTHLTLSRDSRNPQPRARTWFWADRALWGCCLHFPVFLFLSPAPPERRIRRDTMSILLRAVLTKILNWTWLRWLYLKNETESILRIQVVNSCEGEHGKAGLFASLFWWWPPGRTEANASSTDSLVCSSDFPQPSLQTNTQTLV